MSELALPVVQFTPTTRIWGNDGISYFNDSSALAHDLNSHGAGANHVLCEIVLRYLTPHIPLSEEIEMSTLPSHEERLVKQQNNINSYINR